jgi:hypothetical protein
VNRTLLFVNLLLLFFVVSIPFATDTIAAYLRAGGPAAPADSTSQASRDGQLPER